MVGLLAGRLNYMLLLEGSDRVVVFLDGQVEFIEIQGLGDKAGSLLASPI